jgi:hypothetical protein
MPAASAQKCARQHANKLSKIKPTTSTTQTPEILPPSAQPTDSTPALHPPTLPPSTVIDFETFVELADLGDILQFCDIAASTCEGRNLKLFWDRAFEAGLNQGRSEERIIEMKCIFREKCRASSKLKKLLVKPKLISTATEL